MSDRWTGENGQEMCSISMVMLNSAVLMFNFYTVDIIVM